MFIIFTFYKKPNSNYLQKDKSMFLNNNKKNTFCGYLPTLLPLNILYGCKLPN